MATAPPAVAGAAPARGLPPSLGGPSQRPASAHAGSSGARSGAVLAEIGAAANGAHAVSSPSSSPDAKRVKLEGGGAAAAPAAAQRSAGGGANPFGRHTAGVGAGKPWTKRRSVSAGSNKAG